MNKESQGGFIQNIFSSLFSRNDADAEKKRQLKFIAKRLSKSRFNKFYHYQSNEALPELAKFFYEIYKALAPAQIMFQNMQASQNKNLMHRIVIDFSVPDQLKSIEDSIQEEKIAEMGREIPLTKIKEQVSQSVSKYTDYFTAERIASINNLYRQLSSFRDICSYDYYFLLKKFNKNLREKDFSTAPQFDKINAEYILDNLKDFVSIAWAIPFESDWTPLMKLLHTYKGVEPVAPAVWKKVLSRLSALRLSEAFEMMLRLISGNPKYTQEVPILKTDIVEPYLDKLRKESEEIVQKLINREQTNKANDICAQLFGASEIKPLKNYVPEKNDVFVQKKLKTFAYALPLNYCKAFLLEVVKKDMREYYDIVIVRGKWESQTLSTPFSESYNALLALSDTISNMDEQLEDDGPVGMKIKTLILKVERDNGARNTINRLIGDSNDSAYSSIMEVTKNLIEMGKVIKSLVDDCTKSKPILVTNWKELEHYTDIPMHDFSVMVYKKIFLFTTLIKTTLE